MTREKLISLIEVQRSNLDGVPDPCHKNPCQNIARTVTESCKSVKDYSDFECACQMHFVWDDETNSCMKRLYNV
jgi:hypothetical protein